MKIIQFNLSSEFCSKLEEEKYVIPDILCEIDSIFKKYGFLSEINGIYKSNKSDSVMAVLVAQELINKVPFFKEYVENFKMYHVSMEDSFKQLTLN